MFQAFLGVSPSWLLSAWWHWAGGVSAHCGPGDAAALTPQPCAQVGLGCGLGDGIS